MPADKQNIQPLPIVEEIKDSYLNYAMSVIVSRALPDVRDGLKPSQRRILIAMHDLKLGPGAKFRKCAKIAGDTSGNYHPHGEQVIYPTLVRMAQNFNLRYPLIIGQGNFGSIDGDQAAAMRYTEAKMSPMAMLMLEDLDKETVDFVPNYDDTRREPVVLPSKVPNLLINGSIGIAVGMSTAIPPHNLCEVCDGILAVLENPEISIAHLNQIIQGPDFPTGALICGRHGIREAYQTGRGLITVRARSHFEDSGRYKKIVFTEIPYQHNKAKIIEHIAELVKEGKITGLHDIRDESDRKEQIRIVCELKRGENEELILNQLYKYTQLQTTISIIMIALVNGRPQTLNLKEMVELFIKHRREVIQRRTRYLLNKARKRAHIVEGLLIASQVVDQVIALIRQSPNTDFARQRLMASFNLSAAQCDAVLQMRLATFTSLEVDKLSQEQRSLTERISWYEEVLAHKARVDEIIAQQMREIRDKYGDERRTAFAAELEDFIDEDLIPDEPCVVVVTHAGYIKRTPITAYRMQQRYGTGTSGANLKEGDWVEHLFVASAHDTLLFFSNQGKVYSKKVYEIPELSRTAKGRAMINLLELGEQEEVTSLIPVRTFDERWIVMATRDGIIKKTALTALKRPKKDGLRAINLDPGDQLIRVSISQGDQEIMLGTQKGKAIRFHESDVRPTGRTSRGVRACRLQEDDKVVDMLVINEEETLLTVCDNGYGKRTVFGEYRRSHRGVQGIVNIKRTSPDTKVVALKSVREEDQIMLITSGGMVIRMFVSDIRAISRHTQGVRLMRLRPGDKVVAVAKVAEEILASLEEQEPGEATSATDDHESA